MTLDETERQLNLLRNGHVEIQSLLNIPPYYCLSLYRNCLVFSIAKRLILVVEDAIDGA
ncbi:hypothetical protein GCM10012290_07290 [Halolactibacillus alkaliphilus]|uniref:Uncharacterized protein n=1 Tax=Halolactibacillus alkaliphilus TaxID=442899 RepID=A0A511WZJ8_9BACI|nr:hypothetical protein HAL01_05810 [Halolactibacillus alkaliphilus]GGN67093.1 hypothetical protein GCM10012290_07290 [Halolactibacillus alkaliphilus]